MPAQVFFWGEKKAAFWHTAAMSSGPKITREPGFPGSAGQEKNLPVTAASEGRKKSETGDSQQQRPKEIGGRDGPEPVRYGDWEKAGRCIDF